MVGTIRVPPPPRVDADVILIRVYLPGVIVRVKLHRKGVVYPAVAQILTAPAKGVNPILLDNEGESVKI